MNGKKSKLETWEVEQDLAREIYEGPSKVWKKLEPHPKGSRHKNFSSGAFTCPKIVFKHDQIVIAVILRLIKLSFRIILQSLKKFINKFYQKIVQQNEFF